MEKTSFVHSFFHLLSSSALSNYVLGIEKTKVDRDSVTVSTIEIARETETSRTSRKRVIGALIGIKVMLTWLGE